MIVVAFDHPFLRFSRKETFRVVQCVLHGEGAVVSHLSVVFTNNRHIRQVNRQFLGHDAVTDVITFPIAIDEEHGREGEIYVNLDRARLQAAEFGIKFSQETSRLLIHGLLHLLDYDDRTSRQKGEMTKREDHYLKRLSKVGQASTGRPCKNESSKS